ncbi:paraquat-inducible protein A [Geothermobacter hydrogeniphilus]|uniref:Paraquat-inducible protein A n=1 Tax=Geothermobacter hydrogeniphilus TaxID=1969733 RepID=A0A2K2H8D7_9BACT|nr:paraquat-inducible protein A [Geothermobacter hydrogeniphilus]
MSLSELIACHECDLLTRLPELPPGGCAHCPRCGCLLQRDRPNSIEKTLALSFAGLVLFIAAVSFPFLAMKAGGFEQHSNLLTGVWLLLEQKMVLLAMVVLLTCVLFPLAGILGLLYVLLPLHFGRRLPRAEVVFRLVSHLQPWSMMEVFMLGILVSLVKLGHLAEVIPGISLWAFAVLIFVLAAQAAVLDPHQVWERLEALR